MSVLDRLVLSDGAWDRILPHIIGAITVAGMAPTGVLSSFGVFYLMAGLFYGVPMGVQPMKAASAGMRGSPYSPIHEAPGGSSW